jgi:hypothetical protein
MDGQEYDILTRAVLATEGVSGFSCEIGVREGWSSQLIMDQFKNRIHIGIDPYGDLIYRVNEGYTCTMDYSSNMQSRMLSNLYTSHPDQFMFFPMEDTEFFTRFTDGVPIYRDGRKVVVNEYAFVFIDGPHCLEDVRSEFLFFRDKIPIGGAIVFDDINYYPHDELESEIADAGFILMEKGQSKKSYKRIASENKSMPPRKVLIATPSYDGTLDVWYVNSLVGTIRESEARGIRIDPIYMSFDALVQRARNDLVAIAVQGNYDDIIFIDGDIEWEPEWIFKLLKYPHDVVGGTYRKKVDDYEDYVVKALDFPPTIDTRTGLMKVGGLGTGFLKLSKKAFRHLWKNAEPYIDHKGKNSRMVFDIAIQNGVMVSEDIIMCQRLIADGFDIWLDPRMCCNHTGPKKFQGNFVEWLKRVQDQSKESGPVTNVPNSV